MVDDAQANDARDVRPLSNRAFCDAVRDYIDHASREMGMRRVWSFPVARTAAAIYVGTPQVAWEPAGGPAAGPLIYQPRQPSNPDEVLAHMQDRLRAPDAETVAMMEARVPHLLSGDAPSLVTMGGRS